MWAKPCSCQSRLVRNEVPYFLWTIRRDAVDHHSLRCEQTLNHYGKTASFTTKVNGGARRAGGGPAGPGSPWTGHRGLRNRSLLLAWPGATTRHQGPEPLSACAPQTAPKPRVIALCPRVCLGTRDREGEGCHHSQPRLWALEGLQTPGAGPGSPATTLAAEGALPAPPSAPLCPEGRGSVGPAQVGRNWVKGLSWQRATLPSLAKDGWRLGQGSRLPWGSLGGSGPVCPPQASVLCGPGGGRTCGGPVRLGSLQSPSLWSSRQCAQQPRGSVFTGHMALCSKRADELDPGLLKGRCCSSVSSHSPSWARTPSIQEPRR